MFRPFLKRCLVQCTTAQWVEIIYEGALSFLSICVSTRQLFCQLCHNWPQIFLELHSLQMFLEVFQNFYCCLPENWKKNVLWNIIGALNHKSEWTYRNCSHHNMNLTNQMYKIVINCRKKVKRKIIRYLTYFVSHVVF